MVAGDLVVRSPVEVPIEDGGEEVFQMFSATFSEAVPNRCCWTSRSPRFRLEAGQVSTQVAAAAVVGGEGTPRSSMSDKGARRPTDWQSIPIGLGLRRPRRLNGIILRRFRPSKMEKRAVLKAAHDHDPSERIHHFCEFSCPRWWAEGG